VYLGLDNHAEEGRVGDNDVLGPDDILFLVDPLFGVLRESLLFGLVPVFVETSAGVLRKVLRPHSPDIAQPHGGLEVPHITNHDEGRALNDGDRLHNLTLVHLGPYFI